MGRSIVDYIHSTIEQFKTGCLLVRIALEIATVLAAFVLDEVRRLYSCFEDSTSLFFWMVNAVAAVQTGNGKGTVRAKDHRGDEPKGEGGGKHHTVPDRS